MNQPPKVYYHVSFSVISKRGKPDFTRAIYSIDADYPVSPDVLVEWERLHVLKQDVASAIVMAWQPIHVEEANTSA